MGAESGPRLSVVIVTHNSRGEIEGCLESLAAHPPDASCEVVVVDNASTDDTVALVRERWPGVRVLETGRNAGFAGGSNLGIRGSTSEFVLLLNPDTIVPAGAVAALTEALDADSRAAAAGPRIVDGHGRAELSFGAMISPLAELRQKILVVGHDRRVRVITRWVDRLSRTPGYVDWASGACLLIRRADLEAVGLLDERFFMYTEDVDLGASLRARGRRIRFEPRAQIVHLRGRSAARAPQATHSAYRQSHLAFYEKHHPRWVPILRVYLWLRRMREG